MSEQRQGGEDVPLFIRVPGYKHILEDLNSVQQILANMNESIEVLNEVQDVKERSIAVFRENVERLNQQMGDVEAQLPEVHDMEIHVDPDDAPHHRAKTGGGEAVIDDSLKELRGELAHLRDDLDSIE